MQFREFGKTGEMVSALGYGCMRFPVVGGDSARIDEGEAIAQLRYAIDKGVDYIDTAWPYHGGNSETVVGKALRDGYREKVKLATKLPAWVVRKHEDMDGFLNKQREKLQTDVIDFYLVHCLNEAFWANMKKHDVFSFLERAKADGRIRYAGFSFHDRQPLFMEILDAYDWDFCQIQYNFMDEDFQAGRAGLDAAAKKGIGVVVMEPLRGGRLVKNVPDDIMAIWDSAAVKRSPAAWSLRYIWNHPGVSTVLSGMGRIEEIDENISISEDALPGLMTEEELSVIAKVRAVYDARTLVGCTSCGYCMPCPYGVNIPKCFVNLNNGAVYNSFEWVKRHYQTFMPEESFASKCTECGECEEKCPQQIEIRKSLKLVVEKLEG